MSESVIIIKYMEMPSLLRFHSYLTCGFGIFFLMKLVLNVDFLQRKILDHRPLIDHIGLCFFSSTYSFLGFALLFNFSSDFKLVFLHLMWISGALISYFYMRSVKAFLKDSSPNLRYIIKMPLVSVVLVGVSLLSWVFFEYCLMINPEDILPYKNLYMKQAGGFAPGPFVQVLAVLTSVPVLYSSFYFLKLILLSKVNNKLLSAGIMLTLFCFFNDLSISFLDPVYMLPLMFLANTFEVIRVTSFNQQEVGRRLDRSHENLVQASKMSEAGNYYASMAHEVLNSLQASKGYLELFNRNAKKSIDPKTENYLTIVDKQLSNIERIVRAVKNSTRLSPDSTLTQVDLEMVFQGSLETTQLVAKQHGVTIKFQSANGIKVIGIADHLGQVFNNLIMNSIDAIHEMSEKWVEITYELNPVTQQVLITFMDSGRGIPSDYQDKIWEERFSTKKNTGLGLGLSICQKIIHNQNGKIYLKPESEHTTFIIELPLART